MRIDLDVVKGLIKPGARVLDLGCGDGSLLEELTRTKQIQGYGLEIDPDKITRCIAKGVNVIEQDLDTGLGHFDNKSFDAVVMSQTLQAVNYPDILLEEMLRVGKECLISFPNFGHWKCRLQISLEGKMPVSNFMPYTWYNTPNIHFCTIDDFEGLCRERSINILERFVLGSNNIDKHLKNINANLFAETAIYHLSK
ncbi:MAG: methionine biosynthesis protein MetW [Pseudomonadales bacterium]|nr:methionine biosynthesis protein MetW [Pseudomonadales bacterium]